MGSAGKLDVLLLMPILAKLAEYQKGIMLDVLGIKIRPPGTDINLRILLAKNFEKRLLLYLTIFIRHRFCLNKIPSKHIESQ